MAFLSGWNEDNRFELRIDNSKIESALTDFPVMIKISDAAGIDDIDLTAFFDELTYAQRFKIAVTSADGTTELPVEIDYFDATSEIAILHVKVPSISASAQTILYLYFDNTHADNTTYVGDPGSAIAQTVWDSDFLAVLHYKSGLTGSAGDVVDSANDHEFTSVNLADTDVEETPVGEGIDFSETTDYVIGEDLAAFKVAGDVTMEAYLKRTSVGLSVNASIVEMGAVGESLETNVYFGFYFTDINDYFVGWHEYGALGDNQTSQAQTVARLQDTDDFHYCAISRNNTTKYWHYYLDNLYENRAFTNQQQASGTTVQRLRIGNVSGLNRSVTAIMDEFRLSDIVRSDEWLLATKATLADDLIFHSDVPLAEGYDNRFKIEIDPDDVDADLTDFPLAIKLSDAAGLGGYDVSDFFDKMNILAPNDDFAGADNDPWNQALWNSLSQSTGSATIKANEGRLQINTGASGNHHIHNKAKLSGDFDIQVDFTSISGQVDADQQIGIHIGTTFNGNGKWCSMARKYISAQGYYYFRYDDEGSNDSWNQSATSDNSGKLRLTRVGSTVTGYYWNGSGWTSLGGETWVSDDCFVGFLAWRTGTTTTSDYYMDFDNLRLNSGTPIWLSGDDFTGADSDPPNPDLWLQFSGTYPAAISSNKLRCTAGTNSVMGVRSNFKISGDFDIQVDFDEIVGPDTSAWHGIFRIVPDITPDSYVQVYRAYTTTYSNHFGGNKKTDGVNGTTSRTASSLTSSKLRITRSGSTIRIYFWNTSAWSEIRSDTWLTEDCLIDFFAQSSGSLPNITQDYDNFTITSGTVLWPQEKHPNRQKIAVTLADGVTQCPVEIDWIDFVAEKAVLHTKIPLISSTVLTILYLYYDPTVENNTTFIGDIGSTIGQTVWDNDFTGVWHLSALSLASYKDKESARNTPGVNNLGAYGSNFAAADHQETLVGAGVEITAGNERLNVGDADDLDTVMRNQDITIEAVHNPDTGGANNYGRIIEADGSFTMFVDGNTNLRVAIGLQGITGSAFYPSGSTLTFGIWNYHAFSRKNSDASHEYYWQGVKDTGGEAGGSPGTFLAYFTRADICNRWNSGAFDRAYDGHIDEVRISKVVRSDAWIAATYKTLFDELITFSQTLAGFDNRIKITIDSSKVDADLTDFPVMIKPGKASLTSELAYSLTGDDFTGTDDDPPNTDIWSVIQNDGDNASIQSNKLNYTSPGGDLNEISKIDGNFNISGDFDVQVDFDVTTLTGPTDSYSWAANLAAVLVSDDSTPGNVAFGRDSGTTKYASSGADAGFATYTTAHTSGKLRITRAAGVIKVFIWSGSQWEWDGNTAGRTVANSETGDVYIRFWFEQENNSTVISNVDNFVINSGTVIWPQGTHPNRKKIAVTLENGYTQLPVEIDYFDQDDNDYVYHSKVPLVSSLVNTILWLSFDKDVADNDPYVGDVGEAIAQTVWDANFLMVHHFRKPMASGVPGDIKDSTGDHDLTGTGLDDNDILDGIVGEAVKFTNATDILIADLDTALHLVGDHTIEAIVKRNQVSLANTAYIIEHGAVGESLITNLLFSLYFNNSDYLSCFWEYTAAGTNQIVPSTTLQVTDIINWHYVAAVRDVSAKEVTFYLDDSTPNSPTYVNDPQKGASGNLQRSRIGNNQNSDRSVVSSLDEFRLSDIERPAAWVNATYETLFNNLATYEEEAGGLVFPIINNEVIFSGIFGGLIVR